MWKPAETVRLRADFVLCVATKGEVLLCPVTTFVGQVQPKVEVRREEKWRSAHRSP